MKTEIYAIKDTKVAFMAPYVQQNKDVALRNFKNAVNDVNSTIYLNPEDYELWKLGTYNDVDGHIETDLMYIANGAEYKQR